MKVGEGSAVRVIDTPGWEYADDGEEEPEQNEEKWDALEGVVAGDLLRRNLGRVDRVKDVLPLGKLVRFAC